MKTITLAITAFIVGSIFTYAVTTQDSASGQEALPITILEQKITKVELYVETVTDIDAEGNEYIVSETPVYEYTLVIPTVVEETKEFSVEQIDIEIAQIDTRKAYLLEIRAELIILVAIDGEVEVTFTPTK